MKLAIDVDSVLFQFLDSFNAYIDKIGNPYNAKLYTTPITWNMWEYMSITKEQWLAYMHEYTVNHGFLHGNLVENCIPEVVNRLAKRHEIIILTARHHGLNGLKRQVVNDTVDWLAKENIKYHDICFVTKKDGVMADYLLDDAAHNLEDFSKVGIGIAYDAPYNQMWSGLRVNNWSEFEEFIEKVENK